MLRFHGTNVGAPMVYYDDMIGMSRADDSSNSKPMLWKELEPYDVEAALAELGLEGSEPRCVFDDDEAALCVPPHQGRVFAVPAGGD